MPVDTVLAGLGVVAVVVAVLVLLCGAAGRCEAAPACWRPSGLSGRSAGTVLRGEVLLAQRLGRRGIALDCLVRSVGTADARSAVPVHIRASGPYFQLFGASLTDIVLRWVDEGRRVFMDVSRDRSAGRLRVGLRADRSLVVLDVADEGGREQYLYEEVRIGRRR